MRGPRRTSDWETKRKVPSCYGGICGTYPKSSKHLVRDGTASLRIDVLEARCAVKVLWKFTALKDADVPM